MSKEIKQFRFYSPQGANYLYTNTSGAELISGQVINKDMMIYQIGIQSLPGTKFILGDSDPSCTIVIGQTGIFEMDFNNFASKPCGLKILPSSMKDIINNPIGYIIIDLIYENGGASS